MNNFSLKVAAVIICGAALGLGACLGEDKKSKSTAEAPATESKPADATPAETPSAEAPAAEQKAAEAPAPEPAPEAAPATEAAPAPAAEAPAEQKAAEAAPAPAAEAPAPPPAPEAAPAPAAAPAAEAPTEQKTAEAAPAAAPAADAAPAGDLTEGGVAKNPINDYAKTLPDIEWKDGRYRVKETGSPFPVVTSDFQVDWGTWEGFRRYHDACHVCHGPNALGSTFAPSLGESLKTMDYETFFGIVVGGKRENRGGTEFVMPAFGEDKNIMCYLDDIYTYIKARSLNMEGKGGMPPGRPAGREDKSPAAKTRVNECEAG